MAQLWYKWIFFDHFGLFVIVMLLSVLELWLSNVTDRTYSDTFLALCGFERWIIIYWYYPYHFAISYIWYDLKYFGLSHSLYFWWLSYHKHQIGAEGVKLALLTKLMICTDLSTHELSYCHDLERHGCASVLCISASDLIYMIFISGKCSNLVYMCVVLGGGVYAYCNHKRAF